MPESNVRLYTVEDFKKEHISCDYFKVECPQCRQLYLYGEVGPYDGSFIVFPEGGEFAKQTFVENDQNGDPNSIEIFLCIKCYALLLARFGARGLDQPIEWDLTNTIETIPQ